MHNAKPSGSMEGREFLDWLSDCGLLRRESAGVDCFGLVG